MTEPTPGRGRRPRSERRRRRIRNRPERRFDAGLQHERTALAWERTAISGVVAGAVLVRAANAEGLSVFVLVGLLQIAIAGGVLLWASLHYEELHGVLRRGDSVVHPHATRLVGVTTIGFTFAAVGFAVVTGVGQLLA